jgi:hypothetical protein
MPKINGNGGYLVLNGAPAVRIDNTEFEIDYDTMIDDVTDSSQSVAQGLACINKMNSFTFTLVEDSSFYIQLVLAGEGSTVSFFCRRGAVAQWDLVSNTIFKNSRLTNPQDKARRVVVTCEYGTLTRNVAGPGGFP